MKRSIWIAVNFFIGAFAARAQSDLAIESFDAPGRITFSSSLTNATHYRVEWSPESGAPWTNFGLPQLNEIAAAGPGVFTASIPMMYRVVALVTPPGMERIPAGTFIMGNATNVLPNEGNSDELPQHVVSISGFYMDKYEVTKAMWDEVKAYNSGNGYTYSNPGSGKAPNHPVHTVNWYDAAKWCNARSERDGLTPVYYANIGFTTVYKTGEYAPYANWAANGYRLPTEAEWEMAARGGAANTRFPWIDFTNNISWTRANYYGRSSVYGFDLDGGNGAYHPNFDAGGLPYTSPVGSFAPNGYGLYDMAGNVWEWCWDWYDGNYYTTSPISDPRGPTGPTSFRILRGGSWNANASFARLARRGSSGAGTEYYDMGLRCVRRL